MFLFYVYSYVLRSSALLSCSRGIEKVTFYCPIGQEMLNIVTNCCKLYTKSQPLPERAVSSTASGHNVSPIVSIKGFFQTLNGS